MQKDACCSNTGLRKWFCPSIVGVTAGVIMMVAGLSKFIAGKGILTWVGGAALGIFGIQGHLQAALYLGAIAATVEVLGGFSVAVGCRKSSGWAAVGLSVVMAVALLTKLDGMKPLEWGVFGKIDNLLKLIRLDLLLLAVFAQKGLKTIKACCGMDCGSCCMPEAHKKK